MKPRIFKQGLLAAVAAIAISTSVMAQVNTLPPPPPPVTPDEDVNVTFDDKAFQKSMDHLQVKMKDLKVKMNKLHVKQNLNMKLAMKDFNKNFKENFKDFGKDFSGTFNGMVPDMTESFKGLGNFNFNNDLSDKNYKQRVEKGEITEKTKNYSKSYPADGNDVLQISNSFGKITVNTWNKSEFKVDVQMILGSDNESSAADLFNGTNISDSKTGNIVSFKTNVGSSNGRNNHQHIEINYTVYMPAGNAVDINNKFGSVTLPDLYDKVNIKVSYGSLYASALMSTQNNVTVKFGDANVTNFNGGKLTVAYGKLKAGTLNNVDADVSFAGISADKLKGSADVHIKYGDGFRIGSIDRSVRNINIDASFTKINLDFKESENFNFDVTTKFGSFNFDDSNMKVTSKSPSDEDRGWSSTKNYRGYIGKNGTDGRITINASYTGVNFN